MVREEMPQLFGDEGNEGAEDMVVKDEERWEEKGTGVGAYSWLCIDLTNHNPIGMGVVNELEQKYKELEILAE